MINLVGILLILSMVGLICFFKFIFIDIWGLDIKGRENDKC